MLPVVEGTTTITPMEFVAADRGRAAFGSNFQAPARRRISSLPLPRENEIGYYSLSFESP